MAYDVFISHSSKDKTVADAACARLESRGIRCWIAPRDIRPGDEWGSSIIKAIRGARIMVLIFSSHANASPQIRREVERAVNAGATVIPVRIEDVLPQESLDYFLGTPHWLDAFTPPLEQHLDRLAAVIHEVLEIPAPGRPEPAPPPSKPPGKGWLIGACIAVAFLILVALGYYCAIAMRAEKARQAEVAQQAAATPLAPQPTTSLATGPVAGQPWTNSLGVKFVPAGTDGVLFSVWDVRVKDFAAFVSATNYDATGGMYSLGNDGWKQRGDTWKSPGFAQTDDCPVVGVSWNDAEAFCSWLTKKERGEGKLGQYQSYQLPTDAEWSKAVGLNESADGTPASKNLQITGVYPWGTQWPPPPGAGNYAGGEARDDKWPSSDNTIDGYNDGYPRTSPVGSFTANSYGLYDMGGNVWQWCEDWYDTDQKYRVLRGASWFDVDPQGLLSSFRSSRDAPGDRDADVGYRVVVVCSPP